MYCLFQHVMHAFYLKNLGTETFNTLMFIRSNSISVVNSNYLTSFRERINEFHF